MGDAGQQMGGELQQMASAARQQQRGCTGMGAAWVQSVYALCQMTSCVGWMSYFAACDKTLMYGIPQQGETFSLR
jgi:hypothetical protein